MRRKDLILNRSIYATNWPINSHELVTRVISNDMIDVQYGPAVTHRRSMEWFTSNYRILHYKITANLGILNALLWPGASSGGEHSRYGPLEWYTLA